MDGKRSVSAGSSITVRSFRYFGKNTLQGIGITAAAAAVMMLFYGMGGVDYSSDAGSMAGEIFGLYPWYLLSVGGFVILALCISYFKVYFSVLLSVNVTRKTITAGIFLSIAGMILGMLLLAALIWRLAPGDLAEIGLVLLPLAAGVYLIGSAFFLSIGAVFRRWGKIGWIVLLAVSSLIGVMIGMFVIFWNENTLLQDSMAGWLANMTGGISRAVIAAGLLLYLASGIFVFRVMRNQEVRV